MNSSDTLVLQLSADEYQRRVAAALAHVAPGEREEILAGVGEHLSEVESEGIDLVERLGSPEVYASELVDAAGISATVAYDKRSWIRELWAAEPIGRLRQHHAVKAVMSFLPTLQPAWWVLRGYLVVVALAQLLRPDSRAAWSDSFPLIPSVGNGPISALLVIVGIWASVAVGRRHFGAVGRTLVIGANVILVALAMYTFINLNDRLGSPYYEPSFMVGHAATNGLRLNGHRVMNIFPYDAQGRLLSEVQLFDQNGDPLPAAGYNSREGHVDRGMDEFNQPVRNVYPLVWVDRSGQPLPHQPFRPALTTPALKDQQGKAADPNSSDRQQKERSKNQ